MEEHKSLITTCEGDQHVVAAAQHILKALAASKSVSDDLRKTLLDFEIHLSEISRIQSVNERNGKGIKQLENRLKFAEGKVAGWEANHAMIWDSGSNESSEFLEVVGEIHTLTQSLQNLTVNDNWKLEELLRRADGVLQIAMSKLEEELVHILVKHKQYFEPEFMSLHSKRVDVLCDESFGSVDDKLVEEAPRSSDGSQSEASTVDLVNPAILPDLKSIANVMFASKYHKEFCHAFVSSRRDALDEYFVILEMEKLSIESVLKMEWHCLNHKIKKWIRAMKIIVQVYLVSEKQLCTQILGDFGSVHQFCFSEISDSFMLHLLNFGEAIAMGNHTSEKLFRLLDMYEVLDHLSVHVDVLFSEEIGSFVRAEFHKLLRKLGHTARSTFLAFGNAIATDPKDCFPGGRVHHVTKYVLNYIKVLAEYGDTLNLLLADETPIDPAGNDNEPSVLMLSPLARHFCAIVATLESNLSEKAKLYREVALQHIFMMNNIHYMVEKVKTSDLSHFFGDFWLRQHVAKFRCEARSYERITWGPVLSIIREGSDSNRVSEATLKKKCREFSVAFAEVYRAQTGWFISDPGLREDLKISISQTVVHAYRQYTGRHSSNIDEKWNKYTADDIESYILDLFEGSSKSLHHHQQQRK